MILRSLAALLLLALLQPLATAAFAQQAGLTLAQVERKYPRMSPVHIEKCDRDGNEIYTRAEMACVEGIYNALNNDR